MRGIRRSVRKRFRWGIVVVGVQLCMLCLCQIGVKKAVVKRYETMLEARQARLEAAGRDVFVTKEEVKAGEIFTETNVEKRYVLSEQDAEILNVDAIGTVACVDLPAGSILNTSVCRSAEYGNSERTCSFQGIDFSECFEAYDEVDVRIRYGNGENYCVLRNKRLLPTVQEEECCFVLNEKEQLLMSGAGYDAEVYDGAELYLVGVLNEWEEEAGLSMFIPSEPVLLQLRKLDESDNISFENNLEFRKALETRLLEHKKQRRDGLI